MDRRMRQLIFVFVQRIVSNVLRDWTNSVANMKFRELETVQEYEYRLVAYVFSILFMTPY